MKKKFTIRASSCASRKKSVKASGYQILRSDPDGYDLAYGEGPVNYIDYWEDVSLEDLRQIHKEDLGYAPGVDSNFDRWLASEIKDGYIRRSVTSARRTNKRRIVAARAWNDPNYNMATGMYLPSTGEGDTFANQVVTAVNKLVYKWYNDGDVFDNTHGMEGWGNDLSSFANWLYKYIPQSRKVLEGIYMCVTDSRYEVILSQLVRACLDTEDLENWDNLPKKGSIYNCDGPFTFDDDPYGEDDEDPYGAPDDFDDEDYY